MIAVLFEAKAEPHHQARYLQLAAELKPLLADIDGFIDIERFQSLSIDGKILSLSWWRDEEAVCRWKQNVFHQATQAEGRESIFSFYRIRVAQLVREYSSETRGHADV
ncbi:antibiotic biosynthesis monooxygenase family protein [Enterobacter hormaechei]|uniref:antibiotic biosynthesis monooxygenase family protein n=1 Tax=Enterobacter hormaechei TaxID=158836 RepID=UPI003D02082D